MLVTKRQFYGWKLLAIFWLIVLINAALPMFDLGILTPFLADQNHLGHNVAGETYSAFILATVLPAAMMANGWEIRVATTIGSGFLCIGALAFALLSPTPFTY